MNPAAVIDTDLAEAVVPEVRCPSCRLILLTSDGVLRARVVHVARRQAKCKQCRRWVDVPITFAGGHLPP